LHGGTWTQVYSDHPELLPLTDIEKNNRIYELSFKKLREQPTSLIKGAARAYRSFFISPIGSYSFIVSSFALSYDFRNFAAAQKRGLSGLAREYLASSPTQIYYATTAFLWFLAASLLGLIGVIRLLAARTRYRYAVIAAWVGILLSIPFLPPWDAPLMRVYIATVPFFALLPALALSRRTETPASARERGDCPAGAISAVASCLLCLLVCAFPVALRLVSEDRVSAIPREGSRDGEMVKILRGSSVMPGDSAMDNFSSQIDMIVGILDERFLHFKDVAGNFAIGYAYYPERKSSSYVYWDADLNLEAGEWIEVERDSGGGVQAFPAQLRPLE
jgi:hypothetical protein